MKINSISVSAANYPAKLLNIPDKPKHLYLCGVLPDDSTLSVAIVGSRKPTQYGHSVTEQIAGGLAARGVVVVSGLAFGVDSIAHQACLDNGGATVSVLPSDLNNIYPHSHRQLARQILEAGGALVSEYKDNPSPKRWDFLSRNRIVSGLADALIVTEAGLRSGTMSTVAHALDQGREVYAVPGPITSPLSAGCNQLIAQGATPIVNVEEFLDKFAPLSDKPEQASFGFNETETKLIELIKNGFSDGDKLLEQSQLKASEFQQTITMLEINGAIHNIGANQWRI